MSTESNNYIQWFRHTSPYINSHRGKTFVVLLPGDCISQDNFPNIINDLTLLSSLGVRLVVVHGARRQIDEQLAAINSQTEFHKGVRITTRDQMGEVLKAIGHARFTIEAAFSSGLPDSPMYGSKIRVRCGNFVTAMPQGVIDGIDHQLTGKVRSVDASGIRAMLDQNSLALVSPLGYSLTGEAFNLSFADVAIAIGNALQADKLIAYNDDGPITDSQGEQFRELTLLQCERFLLEKQQHNRSNTYFSLRACYQACDGGVSRAHVVSACDDGALIKELYTRDGSGTMVYRDSYETIRRARVEDVVGILNLIEPLEQKGILVKRSREHLETEIGFFTVMEKDNLIVGCAALYPIANSKAGELACVAMHNDYRGDGRAAKLLTHIERQAHKLSFTQLFALTTQTAHWFLEQGFRECDVEQLPGERKALYNYQRRSKVFVKTVQTE
ncbi:amino-acid N-acetyltransferase [Teredinibacter turnerae]|uniref:amino-acid N-acetyltransferase n=1 Tax=Teredinibacter turnerae TaxID=2426 RepID=UPI00037F3102|nr:amino-acid N-acetyltransferase [Teredinibacter turnerae]